MMKRALPLAALALVSACSVYDGMKKMEKNTEEMNRTTRDMKTVTESMHQKTSDMSADTHAMRRATEDMVFKTGEMNSTTKDMAKSTSAMHESTDELKRTSSALDRQTGDLYQDNRQGLSLELRLHIFEQMSKANKQFAKIKYANFYLKSLEFQLWKDSERDNPQRLDELRLEAVQEVIQSIDELAPAGKRSFSPLSKQNNMQNLYALSAALHVVNSEARLPQMTAISAGENAPSDALHEKEDHAPTGVLQLFYEALAAKTRVEAGDISYQDLRPYQASVLKFEEIATYILRVRMNFMTALTIKQLAAGDGDELQPLQEMAMWLRPWTTRVESRNTVQLRYYGWVLGEALATRDTLHGLGIEAPLDPRLQKVIHNLRVERSQDKASSERKAALHDVEERLKDLAKAGPWPE